MMQKIIAVRTKTTWKNALKRDWQLYLLLLFPIATDPEEKCLPKYWIYQL